MALEWWWWWPETTICPLFSMTSFSKCLPTIVIQFDITFDIIGPLSMALHCTVKDVSLSSSPQAVKINSDLQTICLELNGMVFESSDCYIVHCPDFPTPNLFNSPDSFDHTLLSWRSTTQMRNQNICQFDLFCILSLTVPQNILVYRQNNTYPCVYGFDFVWSNVIMVDPGHNLESSTSGSKEYLCPHPTMLPLDIFIGQRRKLEDGVTLVGDQPS